ncbi:tigger transposable element-derived 4-like [Brachionus plicatilis]|uniref:Tigger transposable element-derived 4-like n=1 Tax=Brachionus plicatilis TaxID=10195 RepID=A0A3M7RWR0_BRAPC|nr:tigger transposable element-derived 4-like [Brachionus plicatilis]
MLEKTKSTKRKLIDSKKKTQTEVCEEFKIPVGTMSGIYKRREEFLKLFEENAAAAECQKTKSGKYDDLEKALAEWIGEKVRNGIQLDGPIITTKATEYAIRFHYPEFKPNPGWLDRFKTRYVIKLQTLHGESGSVDKTESSIDSLGSIENEILGLMYLQTFVGRGQELNKSLVQYVAVMQEIGRKGTRYLSSRPIPSRSP